jgi:hypothetical protein
VVFDRLSADEQAVGDLRIRQAVAEELEDLGLALGQQVTASLDGGCPSAE